MFLLNFHVITTLYDQVKGVAMTNPEIPEASEQPEVNLQDELKNSIIWHADHAPSFPHYVDVLLAIRSRPGLRDIGAVVLNADCHAAAKLANDTKYAASHGFTFQYNESSINARGAADASTTSASGVYEIHGPLPQKQNAPPHRRSWMGQPTINEF